MGTFLNDQSLKNVPNDYPKEHPPLSAETI